MIFERNYSSHYSCSDCQTVSRISDDHKIVGIDGVCSKKPDFLLLIVSIAAPKKTIDF